MAKCKTATCSLTLPLRVEKWQIDKLDKRFEIARKIYNIFVGFELKKLNRLKQTPEYREILHEIKLKNQDKEKNKAEIKALYNKRNAILKQWNFTELRFTNDMTTMNKYYSSNFGAITSQSISNDAWRAFNTLLFGKGEQIKFKKIGAVNSVSGKSFNREIRLIPSKNCIEWKGLTLPYRVERGNLYEEKMLSHKVKYVRILRKWANTKYNYYAQIVLEGVPEPKINKKTGELLHPIGEGRVGLDIGPQTIAYVSDTEVGLTELADKVVSIEKEKRRLSRKLDRSKRATNPTNYNQDGITKHGVKLTHNKSKRYLITQEELKTLYRKQADIRKLQHNILTNKLLSLGSEFYVEKMSIIGLARRAKKTEISEKTGKFKRKRRYGKSITNKAPAMLLQILNNKLKAQSLSKLIEIDTYNAKASQFDHINETYTKKSLSQRWTKLDNGDEIQRDLYSAFLIQNTDNTLKAFDKVLLNEKYSNFKIMHDAFINQLKEQSTYHPTSMGV
ncbi:MAG: hypothetical protein A2Y17_07300 [Clostridiales bacterium GWF2_38_85]|nr:MAG: hypothetical protein A2Y17_07300 [Clostridiales bacterium GWF2_38_85]HBL84327.1 transposase [Clostridiales bacterium]